VNAVIKTITREIMVARFRFNMVLLLGGIIPLCILGGARTSEMRSPIFSAGLVKSDTLEKEALVDNG
ncbi:MAG: hypothetical protein MUP11_02290, partial [Anaerolineales bacterium]|nr:hypothetical protein [Anaerolineales bacterium]